MPLFVFAGRAPVLLTLVALTDEFWSGVAVVAAPEVEREQRQRLKFPPQNRSDSPFTRIRLLQEMYAGSSPAICH